MPKSSAAKKRKVFTLEDKKSIIERLQNGERQIDLASEFGIAKSTIGTMWQTRDKLLAACETSAKGSRRISSKKQRHQVMDELEKLLLIWIEDMQMKGEPMPGEHICRKAKKIFEDLVQEYPEGESVDDEEEEDDHKEDNKGFKG
ncbi:unnamed protein product [Notodromas monacha]|uniref:HTH psq-type domain-containing protein n=1 Tax=Notodromas monacha TaxID=399045 RepID=A0A7R9GK76_9CRUS|nr:unnamed protein product [Notodromas monacha]CAG0923593.1 unnamed protein product [Notodromas monacha]